MLTAPRDRAPSANRSNPLMLWVMVVVLAACGSVQARPESAGSTSVSGFCAARFREAALASPVTSTSLDDTIRSCAHLAEWTAGIRDHQALLGDRDPTALLLDRCSDPTTDLGGYAVCRSLAVALATPAPTPRRTRPPKAKAAPAPVRTPRPTPRPTRAPDVAGHQAAVCAALGSIRSAGRALGSWRTLPAAARRLNYELALANLFTPGSTPAERASRRAEAVRRIQDEWRSLRSGFQRDARSIEADLANARRLLADAPTWARGATFRRVLVRVTVELDGHGAAIGRWFGNREVSRISQVLRGLGRTERTLADALRRAPFGCR